MRMIPQSATWAGKGWEGGEVENEEVKGKGWREGVGTGMGEIRGEERRAGGGFNGVCVEPRSPGSVWTQRQHK